MLFPVNVNLEPPDLVTLPAPEITPPYVYALERLNCSAPPFIMFPAYAPVITTVPAEIVKLPVPVLFPARVNVLVADLVTPPDPEMTPLWV